MSQTTLEDDDLFGEAASEVRADVEDSLAEARTSLPDADAMWSVDADNVLGVLNGLRSTLDAEAARDHLRDAKKWYTMGERADAFEDEAALAEEIEHVESLLADLDEAREGVGDLAATLPQVRSALQDAEQAAAEADDGSTADATDTGAEGEAAEADAESDPEIEA